MKKNVGQTKYLVKKKNLDKIVFGNKIISVKEIFWLKKILVKKKFWQRKFCENNFSIKKVLVKNFSSKCSTIFCPKKVGRVIPGAGIYDPPPSRK